MTHNHRKPKISVIDSGNAKAAWLFKTVGEKEGVASFIMKNCFLLFLMLSLIVNGCSDNKTSEESPHVIALNRGKAMRTETSFRTLITIVEQYSVDNGSRPEVSDIDELCGLLKPAYTADCPSTDGWGNRIECSIGNGESYFRSAGIDRAFGTDDDIEVLF